MTIGYFIGLVVCIAWFSLIGYCFGWRRRNKGLSMFSKKPVGMMVVLLVLLPLGTNVVQAMEAGWTNATQLTDGRPLPVDEGPLSTDIFWKLKSAPDVPANWQLWGSLDQQPPFPVAGTLVKPGYPAPEKTVIQGKLRHRLGTRTPSDFSPPVDFTVPVDTAVGCSSPSGLTFK